MTTPGAARAGVVRRPLVVQGLLAALVGGLLVLAALGGQAWLLVGVGALQVGLVLGVLALLQAPGAAGLVVLALAAAAAGDALVLVGDGDLDGLAGVAGACLVAALLHQLLRRERARVIESLADGLLAVVLVLCAACLLALHALDTGGALLRVAVAAAAAALLVGRLGDRLVGRPALTPQASRGWPGLVLAGAAATAAAAAVASADGEVGVARAVLVGLAVAATAATGDLAVDLAACDLRPVRKDARRAAALPGVAALLPWAAVGPVALVAGRLAVP